MHRQAREHRERFGGRPVHLSSPQGRFAEGAALLDGQVLERVDAHGKHMFLGFPAERWVHVHLGLYGKWTTGAEPAPAPRGALRLRLEGSGAWSDLRGPTACRVVDDAEKAAVHARLGPDPLRPDADPDRAWARVSRSRAPIGTLLMDQAVVAGVGNVYRAEVLYRAGIDPRRPGRELVREQWDDLWEDLRVLLRAGVRSGRIVTTAPEDRSRGGRARREDAHYVYRRTGLPCRRCGTPVLHEEMAARNLFRCPVCQR